MRAWLTVGVLLLGGVSVAQRGKGKTELPKDTPQIIFKVVQASKTARYTGERVVRFKARGERIVHREYVTRDGARTRISFPDDSDFRGQVIVELPGERRHFFPDKNEIHIMPPRGEETVRRLVDMISRGRERGHRVTEDAGGEVAGVGTRLVSLIDRDGNTMQKIWIEPNSGVMLKRELLDRTGNPMGGFEFLSVNFKPRIESRDFEINRKGAVVLTQADFARRIAREHGFSSRLLPPSTGWKVEHARLLRRPQEPVLAVGYVSSSGRMMIFQHKGQLDSRRLEEMARGEANIHVFSQGGETFVLVSDLPKTTLERLAGTLRDS